MRTQSVPGIVPNRLLPAMSGAAGVQNVPQSGWYRPPSLAATGRRVELSALDDGVQEAMDARKAAQAAQTGMDGIAKVLDEAISLTKRARDATLAAADREGLQKRLGVVVAALDRVAQDTAYGATKLLDGSINADSADGGVTYRPLGERGSGLKLTISDLSSKGLGLENLDLSTAEGAQEASHALKLASDKLQAQRANVTRFGTNADETLKVALSVRSGAAAPSGTLSLDPDDGPGLPAMPLLDAGLALSSIRANVDMVSRLLG